MTSAQKPVIGVLGAGAMGAGIAQIAATHGHSVIVADSQAGACDAAYDRIARALARDVEKARRTQGDADATLERVRLEHVDTEAGYALFAECDLVIEAIAEQIDTKRSAFRRLEGVVRPECVLGSNTSSLSIAAIAAACERPERALGIHFFNPPSVMPLVEIIPGVRTAPATTAWTRALMDAWGKTTVLALDTPGFIVNRVARPYYGEALRIVDEGLATPSDVDWAMTDARRLSHGPVQLWTSLGTM